MCRDREKCWQQQQKQQQSKLLRDSAAVSRRCLLALPSFPCLASLHSAVDRVNTPTERKHQPARDRCSIISADFASFSPSSSGCNLRRRLCLETSLCSFEDGQPPDKGTRQRPSQQQQQRRRRGRRTAALPRRLGWPVYLTIARLFSNREKKELLTTRKATQ